MAKITHIPKSKEMFTEVSLETGEKRKVAGYARVSTDSDEQLTSYQAQVDYYTNYILANPKWEFIGVYTDEGISGTNTKHRDGFNRMIEDALDGKIDLIITKSVSRFARNTVDSLSTIRKLKENGVEVYFEKEAIWTFDSKGELLLTIMSSLAQEESRSLSENVTWGVRKRFADGVYSLGYSFFLGYDKGPDGTLVINKEEAEIVRMIYGLYIGGKSTGEIAKYLMEKGIPSPAKMEKWHPSTVKSILQNEKYKGDALLQKTFTVDFLTHKIKRNRGELSQYYVEDDHEAIISKEEFDLVQCELERRCKKAPSKSKAGVFSGKLICPLCQCYFGRKIWHSNDKYRKVIWRCNQKYKSDRARYLISSMSEQGSCETPVLSDEKVKLMFLKAYQKLFPDRETAVSELKSLIAKTVDSSMVEETIKMLEKELDRISAEMQNAIADASRDGDSEQFKKKYDLLQEQFDIVEAELRRQEEQKANDTRRRTYMLNFLDTVKQGIPLSCWDDRLVQVTLEEGIVFKDGSIEFRFYNGKRIRIKN